MHVEPQAGEQIKVHVHSQGKTTSFCNKPTLSGKGSICVPWSHSGGCEDAANQEERESDGLAEGWQRRQAEGQGAGADLQLISSLIPSSMALPGIKRFSDRQDKYLPESSAEGVKLSVLVVWLPSMEILSLTRFSAFDPFHQVMLAGGRDPADRQVISIVLSAENDFRSPSIWTMSGRTACHVWTWGCVDERGKRWRTGRKRQRNDIIINDKTSCQTCTESKVLHKREPSLFFI